MKSDFWINAQLIKYGYAELAWIEMPGGHMYKCKIRGAVLKKKPYALSFQKEASGDH